VTGAGDIALRIARRAERADVEVDAERAAQLSAYLGLLTKWNARLNLTALPLDPLADEAVDRLIIEPLVAARYCHTADRVAIDIGSGGGSPAIPLRIAVTQLKIVLVESRARKAVFLREAVRELRLSDVAVEACRFQDLLTTQPRIRETADLVTVRAVRVDQSLLAGITEALRPGGRAFWFTRPSHERREATEGPLAMTERHALVPESGTELIVLMKGPRPKTYT